MAEFIRNGATVAGDGIDGAYEAWAAEKGATRVHSNADDEYPLHVYGYEEEGLFWFDQGGDQIAIPVEDMPAFIAALSALPLIGGAS